MNCAICKRPLLEGAPACVVCGAPAEVSQPTGVGGRPSGPPPAPIAGAAGYGHRPSISTAPPGSAYGSPYGAPPPPQGTPFSPYGAPQGPPQARDPGSPAISQGPQGPQEYYGAYAPPQIPAQMPMHMQPGAAFPGVSMQPMHQMQQMPQASPANNMAVASFVCGMLGLVPLWIGFILCILAIVFGVLGLQKAGQLPGERGKGLAIAGLVLGVLFILPAGCGL